MKKVTSLLLLVGVAAFGLVACGDEVTVPDGNVQGITVTPSTLNIAVGGSGALSADVDGDPDNSVTWSSNAESVATVDGDGNVTGVSEGNAVVTATSTVDDAHSASAEINVTATEEAEVSIASITEADGSPIDVDDVSGQINVTLNVSEGDQSVETVDLLIDGEVASSQDFVSANIVEGAEAQGEVSQITFNFRTDRAPADAAMDGTPVEGEFQNGEREISAQVTLASGDTNTATNSQTLNFNNTDRLAISHLSGGQGIVGQNTTYYGGEDITLAVTPVMFSGRTIGLIQLDATLTGGGTGTADLNPDGTYVSGEAGTVSEAPFQFTIAQSENNGAVEDDPFVDGTDEGHSFHVDAVQDGDGATLSLSTFNITQVTEMFLDFTAPTEGGAIFIGGAAVVGDGDYSAEQAFTVDGATDGGVQGIEWVFNVEDTGTGDEVEDIASTTPLDEQDAVYEAYLDAQMDALGNMTALTSDLRTATWGTDFGAPESTDAAPATDLDGFVFNGSGGAAGVLDITIEDPDRADGSLGAGVDDANVAFTVEDLTNEVSDVLTQGAGVSVAGAVFTVDPSAADDGDGTDDQPGLAFPQDGAYTVSVEAPDLAIQVPNVADEPVYAIDFILDTTAPVWGTLDPAPTGSSGTGANAIVMNIGGDVSDANAIASATISVFVDGTDINGTLPDGCGVGADTKLDPSADEIDQNDVDISNDTNEIEFAESFEIARPPAPVNPVTYCFILTADDEALDNTGAAAPNTATTSSEADVTWN